MLVGVYLNKEIGMKTNVVFSEAGERRSPCFID